jgi:membrane protease subunit (stomatin/prohibitin family)
MAEYDYNAADTWMCSCGKTNTGKFCVKCGAPRPAAPPPPAPAPRAEWVCTCGNCKSQFTITYIYELKRVEVSES